MKPDSPEVIDDRNDLAREGWTLATPADVLANYRAKTAPRTTVKRLADGVFLVTERRIKRR